MELTEGEATGREEAADVDTEDDLFHIERRGIDYVPSSARWSRPRDLFGMWAGAIANFETFVYGAVLMTFGLSFAQAVWIIVLGNLSWLLLGLASLQGPDAGTTTFIVNRAAFGQRGNKVIAFFNWLTQVGFETEGVLLVVLAGEALAVKGGVHITDPVKVGLILAAVVVQLWLPVLGHATIVKVLKWLSVPFVILFAILAALTAGKVDLHSVAHGAGWPVMLAGLAFVIITAGLGWTENGNDYSRYIPRDASKAAIVGWVSAGTAIPSVLLAVLGAAVGTYLPALGTSSNPVTPLPHAFAAWFLVPFLAVAIVQLFSINSLDLYSSGLTLQALGLRLERWQAVLLDTGICCGLTFYAIFSSGFSTYLKDFVAVVIVWIAPWTAIYLTDWALRRFHYLPHDLQRARGGLYWRRGGFHWPALVAQATGMAAAALALDTTFYVSPISSATGGADFSVYMGLVVGAVVYAALAGAQVKREGGVQLDLMADPFADGSTVSAEV
jgi:NCS1 family nucleobase:cation symporter-1